MADIRRSVHEQRRNNSPTYTVHTPGVRVDPKVACNADPAIATVWKHIRSWLFTGFTLLGISGIIWPLRRSRIFFYFLRIGWGISDHLDTCCVLFCYLVDISKFNGDSDSAARQLARTVDAVVHEANVTHPLKRTEPSLCFLLCSQAYRFFYGCRCKSVQCQDLFE